jgi:ABC-type glycerol-3-phosphate transport system permease component
MAGNIDTYLALILPFRQSVGIFLMRQHLAIPTDMEDSASEGAAN